MFNVIQSIDAFQIKQTEHFASLSMDEMSQPQEETGSRTIRSSRVKVTQGSLDRPFDAKVVKVQGDLASLGETGSNNEKVAIGKAGPSSNVKEPLGRNEAGKEKKSPAAPGVTLANFKTSTPKKDGQEGQKNMGVKSAKKARKGILNTSSVFDHEDDVEVRQILAKQMKQAKDCKVGGPQRTSPATAVTPCRKLVAFKTILADLCRVRHLKEPIYDCYRINDGKYSKRVAVGKMKEWGRGCASMMEAEGEAAKAWLANYYPNWRHFVGEEDLAQPSNMEKEKLSCVAVLKACGSADEPQAPGSSPSGEKFPKFHLFQSFFYKGGTYERKLSGAPGVEASGSADVPQAQKSSPAGEKFPTLCSL